MRVSVSWLREWCSFDHDGRTIGAVLTERGLTVDAIEEVGDDVIIEVGLKSEGSVSSYEFDSPDEIVIGDEIEVLLESVESESGLVQLSKRKADRIRGWENIVKNHYQP